MSNSLLLKARNRRLAALAALQSRDKRPDNVITLFDIATPPKAPAPALRFVSCRSSAPAQRLAA